MNVTYHFDELFASDSARPSTLVTSDTAKGAILPNWLEVTDKQEADEQRYEKRKSRILLNSVATAKAVLLS